MDEPHLINESIVFVIDKRNMDQGWSAESTELNYLIFNYYKATSFFGILFVLIGYWMLFFLIFNRNPTFISMIFKILDYFSKLVLHILNMVKGYFNKTKEYYKIRKPKDFILLFNQKKESLNNKQRNIIGIFVLLVLIIIFLKIAIVFDKSYKHSAFNFDQTWIIWLLFCLVCGVVEYYIFSDNSKNEK